MASFAYSLSGKESLRFDLLPPHQKSKKRKQGAWTVFARRPAASWEMGASSREPRGPTGQASLPGFASRPPLGRKRPCFPERSLRRQDNTPHLRGNSCLHVAHLLSQEASPSSNAALSLWTSRRPVCPGIRRTQPESHCLGPEPGSATALGESHGLRVPHLPQLLSGCDSAHLPQKQRIVPSTVQRLKKPSLFVLGDKGRSSLPSSLVQ